MISSTTRELLSIACEGICKRCGIPRVCFGHEVDGELTLDASYGDPNSLPLERTDVAPGFILLWQGTLEQSCKERIMGDLRPLAQRVTEEIGRECV